MTFTVGMGYDIALLLIMLIVTINGWRRGFLSGFIGLVGAVAGVVGAVWASGQLGPWAYQTLLVPFIDGRVAEAVAEQGASAPELVARYGALLPESVQSALVASLQSGAETASDTLAQQISAALEPVILPVVQALIFLLAVVVIRAVFQLLERLFRHFNGVPILGAFNRALGFAFGLVTGAVDCWLLSILLWLAANVTGGGLDWLSAGALSQSAVYTFFRNFNPFLVHY